MAEICDKILHQLQSVLQHYYISNVVVLLHKATFEKNSQCKIG